MPPGRRRAVKRGSAATASRRAGGVKRSAALKRRLLRVAQRSGCEGEVGCLEVDKTHVGTLHRLKMSPTHATTCGAAASPPRPLSSLPARPPAPAAPLTAPGPLRAAGARRPPLQGQHRPLAARSGGAGAGGQRWPVPASRSRSGPGTKYRAVPVLPPVPTAAPAPSTGRFRVQRLNVRRRRGAVRERLSPGSQAESRGPP